MAKKNDLVAPSFIFSFSEINRLLCKTLVNRGIIDNATYVVTSTWHLNDNPSENYIRITIEQEIE